jgi:hypothetical protein
MRQGAVEGKGPWFEASHILGQSQGRHRQGSGARSAMIKDQGKVEMARGLERIECGCQPKRPLRSRYRQQLRFLRGVQLLHKADID